MSTRILGDSTAEVAAEAAAGAEEEGELNSVFVSNLDYALKDYDLKKVRGDFCLSLKFLAAGCTVLSIFLN